MPTRARCHLSHWAPGQIAGLHDLPLLLLPVTHPPARQHVLELKVSVAELGKAVIAHRTAARRGSGQDGDDCEWEIWRVCRRCCRPPAFTPRACLLGPPAERRDIHAHVRQHGAAAHSRLRGRGGSEQAAGQDVRRRRRRRRVAHRRSAAATRAAAHPPAAAPALPFCRGHSIGQRLIDEFLAKSKTQRCSDFRQTAETVAKVGGQVVGG